MRRWHSEVAFMERQRQMDLESHRRDAIRMGRGPENFECICKEAWGIFRKHKQWACSCYICRAETKERRLRRDDRRSAIIARLDEEQLDEFIPV